MIVYGKKEKKEKKMNNQDCHIREDDNWYSKTQKYKEIIKNKTYMLDSIASNLYKVGNDFLANKISFAVDGILDALAGIDDCLSENVDRQVKQAQESSANILRACLAGIELQRNEENVDR